MKITEAFPKTWAERQAERDRAAEARDNAPTRDAITGELIPHCTGRKHQWTYVKFNVLKCWRCGQIKVADR